MKIQVPIIKRVDLLVVGISATAVRLAVKTAAAGKKVFAITSLPYAGEAEAFHYDFRENPDPAAECFFPEGMPSTPNDYKLRLEKTLINSNIDFLYQMFPVKPVFDHDNNFCGILAANRTGFQIIECKALFDASRRSSAAKACGVPFKKFNPGKYRAERYLLGGAAAESEVCPDTIMIERKEYRKYRFTRELYFPDNSPRTLAAAEVEMRRLSWTPETVYASDGCRFYLDDGVCGDYTPSGQLPVALPGQESALTELLEQRSPGKSCRGAADGKLRDNMTAVRMDTPCRFQDCDSIELELDTLAGSAEYYDVVIAGGGTGGAPAAAAAGRAGAKTILLEAGNELGGITTAGRICCYWFGNVVGYTRKLDEAITAMGPDPEFSVDAPQKNCVWKAHRFLLDAADAGVDIRFGQTAVAAVKSGDAVAGVLAVCSEGLQLIYGSSFIDATGNSDLAAAAGAETVTASPEEPSVQGAGLSPVIPGCSYANTDFQFIIDHDVVDATRAFVMARHKFAAQFDIIQLPDTRERRRIKGEIVLQPEDFYSCRTYCDTINIARSNFDTHGFIVHPMFMIQPTDKTPHFAEVPLRALLPRGLKNLLVTGLAVSAHRDCMPLIRMQADVQNQGYAAGLAAAAAAELKTDFRNIDIRKLQKELVKLEILPPEVLTESDEIPGAPENEPHADLAAVFTDPDRYLPCVVKRFEENPSFNDALLLAFHGDARGSELLRRTLAESDWDKGWNYRGMDQFGFSVSPLDAAVFALNRLGEGEKEILDKLDQLSPESEFSHIRAIGFALYKHPVPAAAAKLRELLTAPGMKGFAVDSLRRAVESNGYVLNETGYRNSQLKEFYLAKALRACAPDDQLAKDILSDYRHGMVGVFTLFA